MAGLKRTSTNSKKTSTRKSVLTASKVLVNEKPISAARKPAVRKAAVGKAAVTPEARQKLIEQAAYFAAEKNGFQGNPADYWAQAEAEVSARLAAK